MQLPLYAALNLQQTTSDTFQALHGTGFMAGVTVVAILQKQMTI